MDMLKVKRMIAKCNSAAELQEVITAAQERKGVVCQADREQRVRAEESAWQAVKTARTGSILVVWADFEEHLPAVNIGARRSKRCGVKWTPGTMLTVYAVQPRAKRLWTTWGERHYCLTPADIRRLAPKIYPDELRAQVAVASRRVAATQ